MLMIRLLGVIFLSVCLSSAASSQTDSAKSRTKLLSHLELLLSPTDIGFGAVKSMEKWLVAIDVHYYTFIKTKFTDPMNRLKPMGKFTWNMGRW